MKKNFKPGKSWTLFLDRDGVINKRPVNDYVKSVKQFEFIEGVTESLNMLSKLFGKIIIVTNQQGIGKKLMTENDLSDIHSYMCNAIENAGGKIDKIYHCPDLENTGSKMRKPETGMGLKAKQDFPEIDFRKSIMVGDTLSDMIFGKKLNMFNVLITNDIESFCNQKQKVWDLHFSNLREFTDWVLNQSNNK